MCCWQCPWSIDCMRIVLLLLSAVWNGGVWCVLDECEITIALPPLPVRLLPGYAGIPGEARCAVGGNRPLPRPGVRADPRQCDDLRRGRSGPGHRRGGVRQSGRRIGVPGIEIMAGGRRKTSRTMPMPLARRQPDPVAVPAPPPAADRAGSGPPRRKTEDHARDLHPARVWPD